ncbi:MAG: hypothetical protein AB7L65_01110 [Hyphomonadaceae bacterium]
MNLHFMLAASALFAAAACGQPSTPAAAQPAATAGAASFTDAEISAGLRAAQLTPAPRGQVVNACNDRVTPNIYAADLGGALSRAMVITVGGGPSLYTCYGDGVLGLVLKQEGAGFRVVFSNQGGILFSMPATHNGVHDLMWGGPGSTMPTFRWNGTEYEPGRSVPDSEPTLRSFD